MKYIPQMAEKEKFVAANKILKGIPSALINCFSGWYHYRKQVSDMLNEKFSIENDRKLRNRFCSHVDV
ncbi:MAG: hypothetical protein ACLSA2_01920 [Candidatus Gastranaerophilaceae bacterium]